MDNALRVHHDLYIVGRHAEKVHGLDKLKSLVHHRRGVDGYLRAHAPVRVLYSLFGRYTFKLRAAFASEGAAAACEQDLFKLAGLSAHKTLKDSRMFRIDRNYLRSRGLSSGHDYLARANERFLICKRYALFFAYRGKRRAQSDRAGNGGDYAVGLGKRRGLDESLHSAADANVGIGKANFQLICRIFVKYRNKLGL